MRFLRISTSFVCQLFPSTHCLKVYPATPICFAILLFTLGVKTACCQSPFPPEEQEVGWASSSPFGVGGSARKALPPIDCLKCNTLPACPPRNCCSSGFLYYGTLAWDDDRKNGFCGCPNVECGCRAVQWSLRWIIRQQCRRPFPGVSD